ncbi:hypothetical protein D1631_00355 [Chryseobacterium nematophagum]|uniref:Glycosyltransferase RgtA/B/C/D-like domain-containing protein n=1 Tax=Chryseobacterium nematophagum TaxID=2305228 RepID=A0A3M7TKZ1_9FLAO|nr:hypothetical protein D1631_00210 [Chryseobacterium nematophagum]RNA63992.1 hypothetical protein D1631_00355 [Chryseobacterium nematophagum]
MTFNSQYVAKENIFYVFFILFSSFHFFSIYFHSVLLVDDLAKMYQIFELKEDPLAYFTFIHRFLDTETMTSCPISGFITGSLIYISQFCSDLYFLGNGIFYFSILIIFHTLKRLFEVEMSIFISLLYSLLFIGSFIQYSPIMLNSSVSTILYCISLGYILKSNTTSGLAYSMLFFFFSLLSYKIFAPLIILNIFFIRGPRARVTYFLGSIILILLYRRALEPLLFVNYYKRDAIENLFEIDRLKSLLVLGGKLLTLDFIITFFKSVRAIQYYSFLDYLYCILSSLLIFLLIYRSNLEYKVKLVLLIGGLGIFVFSGYIPSLVGFEIRNLGALRIFFSIFLMGILLYSTRTLSSLFRKSLLLCTLLLNITRSAFIKIIENRLFQNAEFCIFN